MIDKKIKDENIMLQDGIINPYCEKKLERGKKVICRKTINGITMCRLDNMKEDKYGWMICLLSLSIICIVLLFSLQISIKSI